MGREVRMVPPGWEYPKAMHEHAKEMRYVPLLPISYADARQRWEQEDLPGWIEGERLWRDEGLVRCHDGRTMTIAEAVASADVLRRPKVATYEWWAGDRPEFEFQDGTGPGKVLRPRRFHAKGFGRCRRCRGAMHRLNLCPIHRCRRK